MDSDSQMEGILVDALARAEAVDRPTELGAAMRHAVLCGGARVRPRLCLAVAEACDARAGGLAEAAAAAIELMHCASLVHDDLPCFDDAEMRRGVASVHSAFGERLAVLAGDALIVVAFQNLANSAPQRAERLPALVRVLSEAVGPPNGLCAGQAMECDTEIDLAAYQQAKTGALFGAATMMGAAAGGADPEPWRGLGDQIGRAYQVVDDIRDVTGCAASLGKPPRQDARLGRPNAAHAVGLEAARAQFDALMETIVASVPAGFVGSERLRQRLVEESAAFFPSLSTEPAA